MKKKIILKEGDVFGVPLKHGSFVIGLISRIQKNIAIGYFFDILYDYQIDKFNYADIKKEKVILICRFSTIGIEKGEWPLVDVNFSFDKNDWPVPTFKMQDPLSEKYFSVIFDDSLINEKRNLISKEIADKLYSHGLFGYGAVEKALNNLFPN